jgi:CheY-like chemotaxis protein
MSITILVVDDDVDDIELFKEAVEDIEFSVKCQSALSGMEALSMLETKVNLPNIIVVDLNMPMLSGMDFIKTVRENPAYDAIKLFLYSTCDLNQEVMKKENIKINGFFRKPTNFDALSKKIIELVNLLPSDSNK